MDPSCSLCGVQLHEGALDAGGSVGRVHPGCFDVWDALEEALEREFLGVWAGDLPEDTWDRRNP